MCKIQTVRHCLQKHKRPCSSLSVRTVQTCDLWHMCREAVIFDLQLAVSWWIRVINYISTYGKRAFSHVSPAAWNSLSLNNKLETSSGGFQKQLHFQSVHERQYYLVCLVRYIRLCLHYIAYNFHKNFCGT